MQLRDDCLKTMTDAVLKHAKKLPPELKVALVKGMGFTPVGDPHTPECPSQWDSGLRCNCVPGPTGWFPPKDVQIYTHDTWDERLAKRKKELDV